jgi:hypothetical protein
LNCHNFTEKFAEIEEFIYPAIVKSGKKILATEDEDENGNMRKKELKRWKN